MQSCNGKALANLSSGMEKDASIVLYPVIHGMNEGYKYLTKDIDPKDKAIYNKIKKKYKKQLGLTSIHEETDPEWEGNAYYDPTSHSIGISKDLAHQPGTLAHELGHAEDMGDPTKQKDFIDKVIRGTKTGGTVFSNMLGGAGLAATTGLAIKTGDPRIAGLSALITAATQIPIIRNELAASKRGKKILEEAGMDPDEAFKRAYSGVPTYFIPTLASAVPVLGAYIANKHFGYNGLD